MIHRKVIGDDSISETQSGLINSATGKDDYRIYLNHTYSDLKPVPFDSYVYLSLAHYLENDNDSVIVRCAYKKCTNYFLTSSTEEITCQEFPYGESCLNLLKKETSSDNLGAKVRK